MNRSIKFFTFLMFICAVWIFALYKEQELRSFYHENEIHNKDLEINKLKIKLKNCSDSLQTKI